MYIQTKTLVDGLSGGLNLLANMTALLKEAQSKGSPLAIADIVKRLPAEAYQISGEFERAINKLKEDLVSRKVDLNRSFEDLEQNVQWWRWRQYRAVQKAWPRIGAIQSQLSTFFDDVVAVAQCSESDGILAKCYEAARKEKDALDQKVARNAPVGSVLDACLKEAQRLRGALGDL